jgi:hypothetical protein
MNAKFIEVQAGVRYWEDATVNGSEDIEGSLIACRSGNYWKPIIDIEYGCILNWPIGTTADIHFKVCDDGEYWLLDKNGKRIAKYKGDYVPNDFLCHGDEGYGDYIILKVDENGLIDGYVKPTINESEWELIS